MLALFVAFTTVVEFFIIDIFIGGVPMAEHDRLKSGASATGPEHGKTAFGGTNDGTIKLVQQLAIQIETTFNKGV